MHDVDIRVYGLRNLDAEKIPCVYIFSDATQELDLDKFITHEVAFKDINTAFDLLLQGKSLRCTIWMDK